MNLNKLYDHFMVRTLVVLMLSSSLLFSQDIKKSGRYYVSTITKNFTVKQGGTLRIRDVRGDVRVTTWDKNEVFIREHKKMDVYTEAEAKTVLKKSQSGYSFQNNVVEIAGENHRRDWIKSKFDIQVPHLFNVEIQTNGGDIEVDALQGDVEMKTSGGDISLQDIEGTITGNTSGGDITIVKATKEVTVNTSGGDIDLSAIHGPVQANTSGGDIRVKDMGDKLELHTSGGDLELVDIKGSVAASTSGGDIEVNHVDGNVEIKTSGGDMDIREVGGTLEASTSGGDISASVINGFTRVKTSGGDIEVQGLNGGIEAKTSGGDISVEMTLSDFRKDHHVNLRTAGGKVMLTIPAKLPATIHAEIDNSDRWEHYNIYSDFPLTSSEEQSESESSRRHKRSRYIRSDGKINGGGDVIEIYTTNGDIHIRKAK